MIPHAKNNMETLIKMVSECLSGPVLNLFVAQLRLTLRENRDVGIMK